MDVEEGETRTAAGVENEAQADLSVQEQIIEVSGKCFDIQMGSGLEGESRETEGQGVEHGWTMMWLAFCISVFFSIFHLLFCKAMTFNLISNIRLYCIT